MKFYTDGKTVVQSDTRAGAFDELQEIYGHSDIGDIFTAYACPRAGDIVAVLSGDNYCAYDPNEAEGKLVDHEI